MKRATASLAMSALMLGGLVASASPAAAATRESARGHCGSRNMSTGPGMMTAMSRNNPNGNLGMRHAHFVSGDC